MKKRTNYIIAFVFLCLCIAALAFAAVAADGEADEAKTITIWYMKTRETTSDTTELDTSAYENGKQVVLAGEKFILPTTSTSDNIGKEGFQLVWYTEDGRTYKAGEEVSFDKDTKLYRCVAKEVYTMSDLNYAMSSDIKAAILMTDITTTEHISVRDQDQAVLILNGFTMNITKNGDIMGAHRSGNHVYGEGTMNITSHDGKVGEYYVFQNRSHGYNGNVSKTVIGRDVVINAPDFWLSQDWDSFHTHYPWLRVYGTVNVYGLVNCTVSGNRNSLNEIFETANVTITGPSLFRDIANRDNKKYFNNQGFELRIYGGTFNLPAEAANREFWTNDYTAEYENGGTTYYPYELNDNTRDKIKIDGGTFILPDNATPAISDYLTEDYISLMQINGNGILKHDNNSTYYVPYHTRVGYRFVFSKYETGELGTLTVTDLFKSSEVIYKYSVDTNEDGTVLTGINVYEGREVVEVAEDGTQTATVVYDKITDDFEFSFGLNSILFTKAEYTVDKKLNSLEVDGKTVQTVVPAGCEHSFDGITENSNCQHAAYADYTCSVCGHNVHFSWGERVGHNYTVIEHKEATLNSLGSRTYECVDCGDSVIKAYSLDPKNFDVPIKLRHDDGTFEDVTVKANEVFEFSTTGSGDDLIYSVSAIKAFGENSIRNIYGITIPQGILQIYITAENYEKYENVEYGVAVLTVAENSTIDILNIGNLRRIEKIVVEKNTNVTFGTSCTWYSPNGEKRKTNIMSTIDMSAGNHNVRFVSACFEDRDTLNTLKLGENATYDFGYKTFRNCSIEALNLHNTSKFIFSGSESFYGNDMTEIVFPDNLDLSIASNTFQSCKSLASVTFGENSNYAINSGAFLYCPIPKVVFAKNSTYLIKNRAFINEKLTELDMSAGNMTVTLDGEAFCCWQSNKKYCELTSIKFGENSTYSLAQSSLNDTSVTSLILAPNSTYIFKRYVINGGNNKTDFTTLDASADNINVTFEGDAFRDKTALEKLLVNGKNSTYKFDNHSFYNTKVKELVLGENSTYVIGNCFEKSLIETLDASAGGITLEAKAWSFGRSTFKNLLINGKNGNYTLKSESFKNSIVESITLGEGSTYVFENGCFGSVNTLVSIDAGASNMDVTFKDYVFCDKPSITTLNISGDNSNYNIGKEAFRKSSIGELKFGEGSTYTFGYKCFSGGTALETLDFTASNVTASFGNETFSGATGIKHIAFGGDSVYTVNDYAFCDKSSLITLDISGANSTYSFGREAFRKSSIGELKFGEGSTYTFGYKCFYGGTALEILDFTAANVTATFNNEVFSGVSSIKYLAFGEGSVYTIGNHAFNNAKAENSIVFSSTSTFSIGQRAFYANCFESIVFEDDVNVKFTGTEAFMDCTNTKCLYLGKNFQLDNYPFKRLRDLEKLVLMEGVKFKDDQTEEWFFEYMGCSDFSSPIVVYNHSREMVFPRGTFNECDGIILYTVTDDIGTNNEVFRGCTDGNGYKGFTVMLGIPHALKEGPIVSPTCTVPGGTTWAGDGCDCGIIFVGETLNINVYENKHNIKEDTVPARVDTYPVSPIPALGHVRGALITIEYNDGYLAPGVGKYDCERCLNAEGSYEEIANPIFESYGYSVSTYLDKPAMTQGFYVDYEAFENYRKVLPSFTFGIVIAGNPTGEEKQVLEVENGTVKTAGKAIFADMNIEDMSCFDMKVCGISDNNKSKNMIMCAYVFDGNSIKYIDDGGMTDSVVGRTYNSIANK